MLEKIFTPYLSRFYVAAPLCLVAGLISAFAMAPHNLWFTLFIGIACLYTSLHYAKNKRRKFALGWLYGFGYFVMSLSWIGNALLVEGNPYKWAWPLAVSGLPATLALFIGTMCILTHWVKLNKFLGLLAFSGLMIGSELLRGYLFTGFPWNLFGYSWADTLSIAQIASLGSIYILSAITIFWASSIGFALIAKKHLALTALTISLISFLACFVYGQYRIDSTEITYKEGVMARLVQPNINQADKWDPKKTADHFSKLLQLSYYDGSEQAAENFTYIIWPETAIKGWYLQDRGSLGAVKAMLNSYPKGAAIITGALLFDESDKSYSNSIIMIDSDGEISNRYNKSHLVPFGEYIPFQKWIPLETITQFTGFKRGNGPEIYNTQQNLSYSPLVCYEILFPHNALPKNKKADFIVNVTNDAWYGISAGPYQHFTLARFRAIETGTSVLRVANTGITGAIDPLGRVISSSKLFTPSHLNIDLPNSIGFHAIENN